MNVEYMISSWTCCIEIHINDPQQFPLHMELTLGAGDVG